MNPLVRFVVALSSFGLALLPTGSSCWGSPPQLSRASQGDSPQVAAKPNILFILVDDLGKEWISCYGAQGIQTPHIDQLAATGMLFRNAYCMPQCTPTRVTLLTGQYPFRHGWTNHWDVPRWGCGCHFDPQLNASLARLLRKAGYATAIAGKWQIDDFRVEPQALHEAGFDQWCVWTGAEGGNPPSNKRYWDPYLYKSETSKNGSGETGQNKTGQSKTFKGKFGPDVFCDFLLDFMQKHRDQPQLLYYPMCLTHGPLVTTPDHPHTQGRLDKHKAMVAYTDKLVGRLVQGLEDLGLRRRTIIIFTTDNGTSGGITGRRMGRAVRGAKGKMLEAGTAVPLIVNGLGQVPAGVETDALTDFTDILPTLAELAGTSPHAHSPHAHSPHAQWVLDGKSIAPLILGNSKDSPRTWILSVGGKPAKFQDNRVVPAQAYDDRVIRDKRWKLWVGKNRQPEKLVNLLQDPWEEKNLLQSQDPEAIQALQRLMGVIETMPEVDAKPRYRPNPPQRWDRAKYQPPEGRPAPEGLSS